MYHILDAQYYEILTLSWLKCNNESITLASVTLSLYGLQGKQVLKGIQTPFTHQNYGTANILAKKKNKVTLCKQTVNHCTANSSMVFTSQVIV